VQTTAAGAWSAPGLEPGVDYRVHEVLQGGWTCTQPATCEYTVATVSGDGTLGGNDFGNQAEPAGTIEIEKQTLPHNAAGTFDFSAPGFSGTADDSFALGDNDVKTVAVSAGTYEVAQAARAGFTLTALSCDDGSTTSLAGRRATIDVAAGETVRCVFTDSKHASLTIEQASVPDDGQDFAYTTTGTGLANFTLDDDDDGALSETKTFLLGTSYGPKTVTQAAVPEWDLRQIHCTGDDDTVVENWYPTARTATLDVEPGEDVVCRFLTPKRGHFQVELQTIGGAAGDSLGFVGEWGGGPEPFSLTDGEVKDMSLEGGSLYYAEYAPQAGWRLTGVDCADHDDARLTVSDGHGAANVTLDAGETIHCVFTVTKLASVKVVQDAVPSPGPTSFDFTATGLSPSSFTLDEDPGADHPASRTFSEISSFGAKTIEQDAADGWDVSAIDCTGDDDSSIDLGARRATLDVEPGESVVCTFQTTGRGTIEIEKQALPDGAAGDFLFAADLPGTGDDAFALADDGVKSVSVEPGTYTFEQAARTGFDLTALSCDDGSTASLADRRATVDVAAGETVRCVFTDTQRASVTIRKATTPPESSTTGTQFELTPGSGLDGGAVLLRHDGTRSWSVAPGNYTVDEAVTDGYELAGISCAGDADSTGDAAAGRATFRVAAGEDVSCTFSSERSTASIAGESFEDADADGERDSGENGVRGFTVYLDLDGDGAHGGGEPATTPTAGGSWRFDDLEPGSYTVRQASRDGWTCSAPAGCGARVELDGQDATGLDFGAWRPARIVGTTFDDLDHDGVRGETEPVRTRSSLYLDADGDGTRDDGEPTAASGVDGIYSFDGLRPGPQTVRELLGEGWHCSAPDPCAHAVTARSGAELSGRNFGAWRDPEPPKPPEPPTIGSPTLTPGTPPDGGDGPTIGRNRGPDGGEIYLVPRSGPCLPLQLDIPIDAEPGSILEVRLVFRPADGSDEETVVLADSPPEPADGVWSGSIACARDGELELIVKTPEGETRVPVGEVVLIDPSGTIYDEELYASLTGDGADPEAARCGAALSDATVTLQRRVDGEYVTVAPEDAGISPQLNPQHSDADGSYRWDVSEGKYRVRVTKEGYYPTTSRTVSVPPPVLDLHVSMKRRPGVSAPAVRECGQPEEPEMDGDKEGCVMRPVNARVRGRSIRRVVFYLDGRRIETVSRPDRRGVFGVTVQRRSLRAGKHVLRAKVIFKKRARRKPEFLTLRFRRCLASAGPKAVEATPRPGDCATRSFLAWVRGDRIRRVAFQLDGRRLGTVAVADWRGRYGVKVDPAELAGGRHVVAARIEFVDSAGMRPKTVRLVFSKCS
jgi:plastocyanin